MSEAPRVSVVMPAFNAEKYIAEAIESILAQTFSDFEFIIIDDGSTDGTAEIIESYRAGDPRIRVHTQNNSGVATSMNVGCELGRGKYIARMDSDDISFPERLRKQVEYLDEHAAIRICGTWMRAFNGKENELVRYPAKPDVVRCNLPFQFPMAGPSIMFDREILTENGITYKTDFGSADDYLFVVECSKSCGVSSIPEALYRYRIHSTQVTKIQECDQHKFARQIRLMQLEELGISPTENEIETHDALATWRIPRDVAFIERVESWLTKLGMANAVSSKYLEPTFGEVICGYWFTTCVRNASLGPWVFKRFVNSPLSRHGGPRFRQKLKFFLKCYSMKDSRNGRNNRETRAWDG